MVSRADLVAYGNNVKRRRFRSALDVAASAQPATGTVGVPYTGFTLTAEGGAAPYTYFKDVDGLPPGLAVDATTGAVSGTPTTPGVYTIRVGARDSIQRVTYLEPFTLTVGA